MLPLLYDSTNLILSPTSMKYLGRLTSCTKCLVTEERNGDYTLEAEISTFDELAASLSTQQLLCVKANPFDNPQFFEIYDLRCIYGSTISIKAQHIKHSCYNNVLLAGETETFLGTPKEYFDYLTDPDDGFLTFENNFKFNSDITDLKHWQLGTEWVCTLGDWFGGREGSLLDKFRGEYHWDNFNITYNKNRGETKGYCLRWGSNISSLEQTLSSEKTVSHICAYATVYDDNTNQNLQLCCEPVQIDSASKLNKVYLFDCSSDVGDIHIDSSNGTNYATVRNICKLSCQKYVLTQKGTIDTITSNIKVNMRSTLDEMSEIGLCDTVTVVINDKGDTATAQIVKVIYDSLRERWYSLELGTLKTKLSDYILRR